jgi:predicted DNA-binding ribbon-helix-helix protein
MTTPETQPRKRGRPSKGHRVGTHVSLPAEFRAEIEAVAAREGLPMGAIITRFVAAALGKPAPDYCLPKAQDQEELPLAEAS